MSTQRGTEKENMNDDLPLRGTLSSERKHVLCDSSPLWWKWNCPMCKMYLCCVMGTEGSRVQRVVCWQRRGTSNLHSEPLCISKEPQRWPPVSDHYLGPAEGRLGPAWKRANHSPLPPCQRPPPSTHLHFYFYITIFSSGRPHQSPPLFLFSTLHFRRFICITLVALNLKMN